jgi:hypothetical protein
MEKDPVLRVEEALRHQRIALLSDLLALKHKHRRYVEQAGTYDSVVKWLEQGMHHMQTARRSQKYVFTLKRRDRERIVIRNTMTEILKQLAKMEKDPNCNFQMGKPFMERTVHHRQSSFNITIGYMWMHKVHKQLYENCITNYGTHIILSAEKVRVNHKWIELFEVRTFHVGTHAMRSGYVARTKTPKRNAVFNTNAAVAVTQAENCMIGEMKQNLNIGAKDHEQLP